MNIKSKSNLFNNQKGFSLLSVVFVMLALSSVGMGMSQVISTQAQGMTADATTQQAFYAADGAMQHVLERYFMPESDFTTAGLPSAGDVDFNGATVTVSYANQTTYSADITVSAQVGDSIRTISQTVTQAIPLNVPMFSGGDFTIDGNQPFLFGFIPLPSGLMIGNTGSNGTFSKPSHFAQWGSSTSNMNISLPDPDVVPLQEELTTSTHEGDLILGNEIYSDSVHVTGDAYITDTIVNGHIIADGNVYIADNAIIYGTVAAGGNIDGSVTDNFAVFDQAGPNGEIYPALMAEGDIAMNADGLGALVNGMVYAGGDLSLYADQGSGDWGEAFILLGTALIAHGDIDMYNEMGFVFVTADNDLLSGLSSSGNLKLQSWKEE